MLAAAGLNGCATKSRNLRLCDDVQLHSQEKIGLDAGEARLVCGDPKVWAWSRIPVEQKKLHLKGILQDRAYFSPIMRQDDQGVLQVDVGPPSIFASIELKALTEVAAENGERATPLIQAKINKRYRGTRLDPRQLSAVEAEVREAYRSLGHPCPDLQSLANADTGSVVVTVAPGPRENFSEMVNDRGSAAFAANFERYWAFRPGQLFDGRLLQITEQRIIRREVAQQVVYSTVCSKEKGFDGIARTYYLGPPRLFKIGVGVNTEEFLTAETSLKHTRLDPRGSSAQVALNASFFRQSLELSGNWFYKDAPAREYLGLSLTTDHSKERDSSEEYASITLRVEPTRFRDFTNAYFQHSAGPQYSVNYHLNRPWRVDRGLGFFYAAILESHLHEFSSGDPMAGHKVVFNSLLGVKQLLSTFSALNFNVQTEHLWPVEIGHLRQLVLGLRTDLFETLDWDRDAQGNTVVPNNRFRRKLGGSANIRGFNRDTLPGSQGEGVLSAFYLGAEARFKKVFGPIEPLAFLDFAATGARNFYFSPPYYLAPGLGARWKSPFGTLRSTLALGYLSNEGSLVSWKARPGSRWPFQFYFSYGEEF